MTDFTDKKEANSRSPAITRAVKILDLLAASKTGCLTQTEISVALDLAKSSTAHLLSSLEDADLVHRTAEGYMLGRKLVGLASAYLNRLDTVQEFYRFCKASPVLSTETVRIALLDKTDVIYLARFEGHAANHLTPSIGDRMPASLCAVGKAMLAKLDTEDVDLLYASFTELPVLTEFSLRTVTELKQELIDIRQQGFALENQESALGVVCLGIAVPSRGINGPKLGVSVSSVTVTFDEKRKQSLLSELDTLAALLGNPLHTRIDIQKDS
ncbi:IclR family transcriptional regulator [Tatumella citrea]|uniref:HTH-type transcriptional repressor AllR n=1 Tax=Tatumella citrea TaxID=53336 RepID=A0A1Y0LJP9_TATCI|nr:IclR family transcriptional regulator [Tatumella citrea]ARU93977.1 IclR family transcriptional regulator [Tatumella citrea]ARU98015.1 IclR family transcriptional regulator [Tatumella citrea]